MLTLGADPWSSPAVIVAVVTALIALVAIIVNGIVSWMTHRAAAKDGATGIAIARDAANQQKQVHQSIDLGGTSLIEAIDSNGTKVVGAIASVVNQQRSEGIEQIATTTGTSYHSGEFVPMISIENPGDLSLNIKRVYATLGDGSKYYHGDFIGGDPPREHDTFTWKIRAGNKATFRFQDGIKHQAFASEATKWMGIESITIETEKDRYTVAGPDLKELTQQLRHGIDQEKANTPDLQCVCRVGGAGTATFWIDIEVTNCSMRTLSIKRIFVEMANEQVFEHGTYESVSCLNAPRPIMLVSGQLLRRRFRLGDNPAAMTGQGSALLGIGRNEYGALWRNARRIVIELDQSEFVVPERVWKDKFKEI